MLPAFTSGGWHFRENSGWQHLCLVLLSFQPGQSSHSSSRTERQWGLRDNAESWKDESIHSPWIAGGPCASVGYPEFSRWHGRRVLMCTWKYQAWDGAVREEGERQKTPPVEGDFMPHPLSVSVLTKYKQYYHAGTAELFSTQPWKT